MFIEFQVANFRSFRDLQKFSMQASPLRTNDGGLEENNVFKSYDLRLLKTKAIYGGNASGKSNFIKALSAFCHIVNKSVSEENFTQVIWENRFQLISDWDEEPVFFQLTFLHNEKVYRYGFQILRSKIVYEWLFAQKGNTEEECFMRSSNDFKISKEVFGGSGELMMEQALSGNNELFRTDSLFLTAGALSANKLLTNLRNEIKNIGIIDGISDEVASEIGMFYLQKGSSEQKRALKNLISSADTGIEDLEMEEVEDDNVRKQFFDESPYSTGDIHNFKLRKLISFHSIYDENGHFKNKLRVSFRQWESEGTAKLFGIGALILEKLHSGTTLAIDEFDARFHPNLTLKIVNLFNHKKTNPLNAQLIFVTHDTGLLRRAELRRDQICFVDKDKYGISTMKTLIEFTGVRKDASYEKEYLNGSYGAVPFLDEMDWLITQNLKQGLHRSYRLNILFHKKHLCVLL